MIKATAKDENGREILILGLSHANLDRLRADGVKGYILIKGSDWGHDFDIYLTAAPTESAFVHAFVELGLLGPNTKLNIEGKQ